MIKDLQNKLEGQWDTFTTSEQKIAAYLLRNLKGIPFETASSLAQRVGVSPMTVGRFLRMLGYARLNELKKDLRNEADWLSLYKSPERSPDADFVSENLRIDTRVLANAYALARTEEWASIVKMLVAAERVSVVSFHQARFIGIGFANLLQQVKPRTSFADGVDGVYADVLLDSGENSCVVLIDFRRYAPHFRVLAEEVIARGIPLAIITDTQCYWARRLTDKVLMLPIDPDRVWHNFGAVISLLSLLISAVTRGQDDTFERIGKIAELRRRLVGYEDAPPTGRRSKISAPKGRTNSATGRKIKTGVATRKPRSKPRS